MNHDAIEAIEKIRRGQEDMLAKLRAHKNGTLKLEPTQIKAAMILLRKVMTEAQIKSALKSD